LLIADDAVPRRGANASPIGRSHQEMSGANASPTRSASAIARSLKRGRSQTVRKQTSVFGTTADMAGKLIGEPHLVIWTRVVYDRPYSQSIFFRWAKPHHRKERWPRDQKIIPMRTKRKTTPAASASVAARNILDDAATPPCGDARSGITLDSNLFTALMARVAPFANAVSGGTAFHQFAGKPQQSWAGSREACTAF